MLEVLDLLVDTIGNAISLCVGADRRKYDWDYFFNNVGLIDKDKNTHNSN